MLLELQPLSFSNSSQGLQIGVFFFFLVKISRLLGLHPFSEFFFFKGKNEEMTKLKMLMKHEKTSSKSRIEVVRRRFTLEMMKTSKLGSSTIMTNKHIPFNFGLRKGTRGVWVETPLHPQQPLQVYQGLVFMDFDAQHMKEHHPKLVRWYLMRVVEVGVWP